MPWFVFSGEPVGLFCLFVCFCCFLKHESKVQVFPALPRFALHFTFMKDLLKCLFSHPEINPEDFCFYERGQKGEIVYSICFAVSHDRGSMHPRQPE